MGKTKEKKLKRAAKIEANLSEAGLLETDSPTVLLAPAPQLLEPGVHRAWGALIRSHALWIERIERRSKAGGGLSLEAYDALLVLSYAPGGRLRMGELYESVTLSRSGLTRLIDRLEKDGLVRREVCPNDRRSFEAILTPAGEAARARSWPFYAAAIAEEFGRFFNESEVGALADLLERPLRDGAASTPLLESTQ